MNKRSITEWIKKNAADGAVFCRNISEERPALLTFFVSFCLTALMEILGRHSFGEFFMYIGKYPMYFFCNIVIVWGTISLGLLVKRRYAAIGLLCFIWLGFGVANCIVQYFRVTPLGAMDLILLPAVFDITKMYLGMPALIFIIIAILLGIAGVVWWFIKAKKYSVVFSKCVMASLLLVAAAILSSVSVDVLAEEENGWTNLGYAYKRYGFAYSLTHSIYDWGIDEPEEYSDEEMDQILGNLEGAEDGSAGTIRPNVVMVQLESFFDVNLIKNLTYSENPIPVFTQLQEKYPSGFLTVPVLGAGTINTEFEVLSGMSTDFFGAGEYPYKTVLQDKTCETICYDLSEQGYKAHAIHNNRGTFYDRYEVYANMGFDTFTSIEYMSGVEYNSIGWAKDNVLTEEVMKALRSTKERDMVFTVTVQGHGNYVSGVHLNDPVTVTGIDDEDEASAYEYYLTQLRDTDAFIGDLVKALSAYKEPVVLVLYGDHLPFLDLEAEDLENSNLFQTPYIIWSNYGTAARDEDMPAYQLSSHVLDIIGVEGGIIARFHSECAEDAGYRENLEMLEYDMLYGDQEVYDGKSPYEPKKIVMGVEEITVKNVWYANGLIVIEGSGFTDFSVINVDGDQFETRATGTKLVAECKEPRVGDEIVVEQISSDGISLSQTKTYYYGS